MDKSLEALVWLGDIALRLHLTKPAKRGILKDSKLYFILPPQNLLNS